MTLDFTHGHAAGVERQNLVVKARPTGLVLRDDLRLKAAVAVTGNFYRQLAKVALEGFAALAVAGVARRVGNALILGVAQVFSHLGLKGSLHQFLGEQLEQAVLTDEVFRLLVVSQQVVDQFVRDGHLFAVPLKCSSSLPIDRLHKNSYTPDRVPAARQKVRIMGSLWSAGNRGKINPRRINPRFPRFSQTRRTPSPREDKRQSRKSRGPTLPLFAFLCLCSGLPPAGSL